MIEGDNMENYQSVIFVVRNPYDAYMAEYNRQASQNHLGYATETDFRSEGMHDHNNLRRRTIGNAGHNLLSFSIDYYNYKFIYFCHYTHCSKYCYT